MLQEKKPTIRQRVRKLCYSLASSTSGFINQTNLNNTYMLQEKKSNV